MLEKMKPQHKPCATHLVAELGQSRVERRRLLRDALGGLLAEGLRLLWGKEIRA